MNTDWWFPEPEGGIRDRLHEDKGIFGGSDRIRELDHGDCCLSISHYPSTMSILFGMQIILPSSY